MIGSKWLDAVDREVRKQRTPRRAFSSLTTRQQVVELKALRRVKEMKWVVTPKEECECVWSGAESKPCEMHRKQALGKYWTPAEYRVSRSPAYGMIRK